MKRVEDILADNLASLMASTPSLKTATKLSASSGVGVATVWRIKNRRGSAQIDVVDKLAQAFGLRAANLLLDYEAQSVSSRFGVRQAIAEYETLSEEALHVARAWQELDESDKNTINGYLSVKSAMTKGLRKNAKPRATDK